ncbi:riboflavin synthase [Occultella glacieicola]|uniref:Riboflavin synthase n=1 Tax=Occultella glacieicola TaxID=2518684 RepID=A0ABY2E4P8_9MICO|nr:riboflavin synthase [Occultella glacieicola]TDE94080.1 riboflavin synthase [Occultella glacieicola]
MFTGIIEELGTVEGIDSSAEAVRLHIRSPLVLSDAAPGDSITVNGCCLTVTEHDGQMWSADVIGTTLAATSLGGLAAGDRVNLERSLRADARLGGHIVQGHVDGVGEVLAVEADTGGGGGHLVRIALPDGVTRYVVDRGSIAVDGVSLTVVSVTDAVVTIGLIPETLTRTTLGRRGAGSRVNIEVDVLAKYVENLLPGLEALVPR